MKKLIVLVLLLAAVGLNASELNYSLNIEQPYVARDGNIAISSRQAIMDPGHPAVPFITYQIVLPYGENVANVNVEFDSYINVSSNMYIAPAQEQVPLSQPVVVTEENSNIYDSSNPYPEMNYELVTTERLCGMDIAIINIYPYKYTPSETAFGYYTNASIKLTTEYDESTYNEQQKMICKSESALNRLNTLAMNPEMAASYPNENEYSSTTRLIDPNDPHDYLIIAGEDYTELFEDYAAWKATYGANPAVFTIESIYTAYLIGDPATKLRTFISDAYTAWASSDTPLEYVLLAGDDEIIPVRFCYGQANGIESIPTDMYFGCLDGSWNADNDATYGEPNDQADLYAEVHIGRFPGDNLENFENMIRKTKYYVEEPSAYLDKATMLGEALDEVVTWGGTHKDYICENPTMLPEYYHVDKLYEREGTFSVPLLTDHINANSTGLINHMGHCNYFSLLSMNTTQIDNLRNTMYYFLYSQGCVALGFDEETSGAEEAVGEHMVFADGGAFAFVGNTRNGWYSGNYRGASQLFDEAYFYGLFTEDIREIGRCVSYMKESMAGQINNNLVRFVMYEQTLAGDPNIQLYNSEGTLPDIQLASFEAVEHDGDMDGTINPGEQVSISLDLFAAEDFGSAVGVTAEIVDNNEYFSIVSGSSEFGDMEPGNSTDNGASPFVIELSETCPPLEQVISLHISGNYDMPTYFSFYINITISPTLYYPGFPYDTEDGVKSSVMVLDVDGDGAKDLVTTEVSGNVLALTAAGNILPGFPAQLDIDVKGSIAAGNLDSDPNPEFVIAGNDNKIAAIDHNGSVLFLLDNVGPFIGTPTLFDVNGDDIDEIIIGSFTMNLFVFNADGTNYGNFPVQIGAFIRSSVSVGDIDDDGQSEFVFGSYNGNLNAIEFDGQPVDGYPISLGGNINNDCTIFNSGQIAVSNSTNHLFIIDNGSIVTDVELSQPVAISQAACDMDNDDMEDLVFALTNGNIYAMSANGTVLDGFPVQMNYGTSHSPLITYLNNDSSPDIVAMDNDGNLYVYNNDGALLMGFPVIGDFATESSLTVCDIDGNGTPEVAAGMNSGFTLWDLKMTYHEIDGWDTYLGNYARTGNTGHCLDTGVDGNNSLSIKNLNTLLGQNYPNPFNPVTNIMFLISDKDSQSEVELNIYNVKGQLIRTLAKGIMSPGQHSLIWDGKNSVGNDASSGIYFYKLKTGDRIFTQKMLLLK